MSLAGAAAALGLPEALVQRSAAARAAESGQSVEEILAAWAGGETVAAPTAPSEPEPAPSDVESADTLEPTPAPDVEIAEPAAAAVAVGATPSRKPVPAEVTAAEASHLPEVITVPTAGIKERTNFVIPKWLTALLVIVPLFALFALGGSSTGACGEATELATNVITGEIVNCDGSEFTGGGAGGGATDYVALGDTIFHGEAVSGVNCAGCHGVNGEGGGAFPALTGVLTTFGSCADHIEWVTLGSAGFPDGHGDTNKTTNGGMPAFGGSLSEEQIAAVAAYERVRFGGGNPDEVLVDCGLAEAAPADGQGGTGDGTDQGATTSTTVASG
jgi:mono/diheme cytochrome c family protein